MQIFVCYTNRYLPLLEKRVTYIGYKSVVFLIQLRFDHEFDFHQHVIQPNYQPEEITTKIGIAKKKEKLARLLPSPPKYKTKIISCFEFPNCKTMTSSIMHLPILGPTNFIAKESHVWMTFGIVSTAPFSHGMMLMLSFNSPECVLHYTQFQDY
jgi:hypothetical protein